MYLLRRLPVTTSVVAMFTAYTATSVAVRKIKKFFSKMKISGVQEPFLLQDVQHEILRMIIREMDPHMVNKQQSIDLLELCLVCKDWFKFISNNDIWFKFLEALISRSDRFEEIPYDGSTSDVVEKRLGRKDLYSPKIMYHIFSRRIDNIYHGQRPRPVLVKLTADPKKYKNLDLWTPWSNHNWLKTPEIIFKWIYTTVVHADWFYPLYFDAVDPKRNYGKYKDTKCGLLIQKLLFPLSFALSVLPWIDNVLWYSKDLIRELLRGNYWLLWMKDAWPIVGQIQSAVLLLSTVLFDDLYLSADLMPVRGALSIATLLVMRGLGPFCISLASFALAVGVLRIRTRGSSTAKFIIAGIFALAPLVYYYPVWVLSAATFAFTYVVGSRRTFYGTVQTLRRYSAIFLALSIATVVWTAHS